MFVTGLFCGWIRARQAAGADPEKTAARLLAWMEEDPSGFCDRPVEDAVEVLDKAGRAALTEQVRAPTSRPARRPRPATRTAAAW